MTLGVPTVSHQASASRTKRCVSWDAFVLLIVIDVTWETEPFVCRQVFFAHIHILYRNQDTGNGVRLVSLDLRKVVI